MLLFNPFRQVKRRLALTDYRYGGKKKLIAKWIDTGTVIVPEPLYDREKMGEPVREWEGEYCEYYTRKERDWRGIYCYRTPGLFEGQIIEWGRRVTCARPYTKEWRKRDWRLMERWSRSFNDFDFARRQALKDYWGWSHNYDDYCEFAEPAPCFVRGWDERTGKQGE